MNLSKELLILGCDWMQQHNPISIDLRKQCKSLTIQKNGAQTIIFTDFTAPPSNKIINMSKLEKICRVEPMGYVIQVKLMTQESDKIEEQKIPETVKAVIAEFNDVFSNKFVLPPQRSCDHTIPLQEGSRPPNMRSYRIPHKQKDEVERLIKEMLQDSLIRPSHNPYSSQSILVRKKDGSWRMCIDYRDLNS
jgi:hypothetical protein